MVEDASVIGLRIGIAAALAFAIALRQLPRGLLGVFWLALVIATLAPLSMKLPLLLSVVDSLRAGNLLILASAVGLLLLERRAYMHRGLTVLFTLLLLLSAVSALIESVRSGIGGPDLVFNIAGLLLIFLAAATMFVVSNILVGTVRRHGEGALQPAIHIALGLIVAVCIALVLIGLRDYEYGFFNRLAIGGGPYARQSGGPLGHLIMLGLLISQAFFLRSKSSTARTLWMAAILVLGLALTASFVRSAWVGWVAGTVGMAMSTRGWRLSLLTVALVAIGTTVYIATEGAGFEDIRASLDPRDPGVYVFSRLAIWEDVIRTVVNDGKYLVLGLGPGNYYLFSHAIERGMVVGTAHNQYLDILTGSGVLGLLVWALILLTLWRLTARVRSTVLRTAAMALLLAFATSSLAGDFLLPEPRNAGFLAFTQIGYFWIVMGLVLGDYLCQRLQLRRGGDHAP